jgi:hypothetical protein
MTLKEWNELNINKCFECKKIIIGKQFFSGYCEKCLTDIINKDLNAYGSDY